MEDKSKTQDVDSILLETRKVKALEKIANSMDALTVWFEEIDKKEWGERLAWYLYEWHTMAKANFTGEGKPTESIDEMVPPPPRKVRPKKDIEKV